MKLTMLLLILMSMNLSADENAQLLFTHDTQVHDIDSVTRGAQAYMDYCASCHSLEYVRYQRLATDLTITEADIENNWLFAEQRLHDPIISMMLPADAEVAFGVAPPDLSLIAKTRGEDWLYSFMLSFYEDFERPLGVNNLVYKNLSMPHVLVGLQGQQVLKSEYLSGTDNDSVLEEKSDVLYIAQPGELTESEYQQFVFDLVNFMAYVSDPSALERKGLGWKVLIYLFVLLLFVYLLKKEFWRDID